MTEFDLDAGFQEFIEKEELSRREFYKVYETESWLDRLFKSFDNDILEARVEILENKVEGIEHDIDAIDRRD